MALQHDVLHAYNRAIARHRERTGESYPFTRANRVDDDGTITDTNVYEPQVLAKWSEDSLGRIRVRLV
jgi:hypothetical protein